MITQGLFAMPPAGLEPATIGLEVRRSFQLSYGGVRETVDVFGAGSTRRGTLLVAAVGLVALSNTTGGAARSHPPTRPCLVPGVNRPLDQVWRPDCGEDRPAFLRLPAQPRRVVGKRPEANADGRISRSSIRGPPRPGSTRSLAAISDDHKVGQHRRHGGPGHRRGSGALRARASGRHDAVRGRPDLG